MLMTMLEAHVASDRWKTLQDAFAAGSAQRPQNSSKVISFKAGRMPPSGGLSRCGR